MVLQAIVRPQSSVSKATSGYAYGPTWPYIQFQHFILARVARYPLICNAAKRPKALSSSCEEW